MDISEILMFDPTEAPQVCSAIMILSDDILEEVEFFNVTLSNPLQDNSLIFAEPDATVTIIDISCKYTATIFNLYTYTILYEFLAIIFTLEQPTYTIIESNNTLSVCVDLIQGQLAREVFFNLFYQHITTEGKNKS